MILVNGKYKSQRVTGVQRYAIEIVEEWKSSNLEFEVKVPGSFPSFLWEQTLKAGKNQLLWCPTNSAPLFGRNKIVTLHDCAVFYNPDWFSAKYKAWRQFAIPKIINSSKSIITVSKFSKAFITDYFDLHEDSVKAIHNGINLDEYKPLKAELKELELATLNIDFPYFLCVGSMDPRKNIQKLIEAWSLVSNEMPNDFKLIVVGGSNSNFSNSALINSDNIKYTGYVSDNCLKALYQDAHAFIFPSLFEGFGLPILEAMAYGLPVLSSNTSAMPEVGGQAALYFQPDDTKDIAEKILALIENPSLHEKHAELSSKQVKKFSWAKTAHETYEHLRKFA